MPRVDRAPSPAVRASRWNESPCAIAERGPASCSPPGPDGDASPASIACGRRAVAERAGHLRRRHAGATPMFRGGRGRISRPSRLRPGWYMPSWNDRRHPGASSRSATMPSVHEPGGAEALLRPPGGRPGAGKTTWRRLPAAACVGGFPDDLRSARRGDWFAHRRDRRGLRRLSSLPLHLPGRSPRRCAQTGCGRGRMHHRPPPPAPLRVRSLMVLLAASADRRGLAGGCEWPKRRHRRPSCRRAPNFVFKTARHRVLRRGWWPADRPWRRFIVPEITSPALAADRYPSVRGPRQESSADRR